MFNLLLTRIASALLVILGVATLVFMLIHFVPGDPVEVMLGESSQQADREVLRESLGLNKPIFDQYILFLGNLLHFNLGDSLFSKRPIVDVLFERIPATFQLALTSLAVALVIALPLGAIAAIKKGSIWDVNAMIFSLIGISVPNFLMGPLLILVFSLFFGWLPVSGREGMTSIILPALTLGTSMAAILSRMVRSTLLEVLHADYIRTAYAKGLSEYSILFKHAFKNALLPIITLIGLQLGILLGGAVITEIIFSWPGVGQLTIEAIQRRDYPLLQGCVLLISGIYVIINTGTDVVYALVDPRIRLGK